MLKTQNRVPQVLGTAPLHLQHVHSVACTPSALQEVAWFDRDENNSAAIMNRLSSDALAVKGQAADSFGLIMQVTGSPLMAMWHCSL